ncbi:MAG: VCBS repeat-containing protein [Cyclobacteriaceae bacterium]
MRNFFIVPIGLFLFSALLSCDSSDQRDTLFRKLSPHESGIDFTNELSFDQQFNIFTYRNYYNGGGVGLGDVNNDGLLDVYMTANLKENKLYLNQGELSFEDITTDAGVAGERSWSTGVSMADVNGDGYVDIYVCNSGDISGDNKQNELFINNGDLTFTESAAEYGLADPGFSTHAAFFDYDKDGDLDLYLLNNSYQAIGSFNLRKNERPNRDPVGGDKLFRNDNGKFADVSEEAGIYGSVIGFGLGVTVGDIDMDGWQDIYVSNDFFERDYLYLNNGDGTFREELESQIRSLSAASMGADLADINNDGQPDIFVTDMLPEVEARIKTVTTFDNWDRYRYNLDNGYWHQFTRNVLQLNNGDNTFSEIGRLAGVNATDWSWGALVFDFENDGLRDIFIANGIYQDLTNQDFLQFVTEEEVAKKIISSDGVDYEQLISYIPSQAVPNYAYQNNGDLTFSNKADDFGLAEPSFSNGAAYGDLDNDGDLDLIVNNVNMTSFVYENTANLKYPNNRFLRFELKGEGKNTMALGTNVKAYANGQMYYAEQMPIRGFQSTMDHRLLMGLGQISTVDSVVVTWPNGTATSLEGVETNQTIVLSQAEGTAGTQMSSSTDKPKLFEQSADDAFDFRHAENQFVDFDRDRLVYHMRSTEGPCLCKGDINNDGLEDIYIGGAKDQSGQLYVQRRGGGFQPMAAEAITARSESEDVTCSFFDANGDGYVDLYIGSGGSEFSNVSTALADALYTNQGGRGFTKTNQILPAGKFESSSTVDPVDFDGDGDIDLFVGIRLRPGLYGLPNDSYLLENDGAGNFTDASAKWAPDLSEIGMVTDATWSDINADGAVDLVLVGDWMPVTILINEGGKLVRQSPAGLQQSNGWWNHVQMADVNADGLPDIIAGNHGLNSRFKASADRPVSMYVNDFDRNGTVEQVVAQYNGAESYPMVLRHDLVMQMPHLKKKYLKYDKFKEQRIEDIFTPKELEGTTKLEVYELASSVYLNKGNFTFEKAALPIETQFSVTYDMEVTDFNSDGHADILLGGNLFDVKPEVGRYDAQYGLILLGDSKGGFTALQSSESGLRLEGQLRAFEFVDTPTGKMLLTARNNATIQSFHFNPEALVIPDKSINLK